MNQLNFKGCLENSGCLSQVKEFLEFHNLYLTVDSMPKNDPMKDKKFLYLGITVLNGVLHVSVFIKKYSLIDQMNFKNVTKICRIIMEKNKGEIKKSNILADNWHFTKCFEFYSIKDPISFSPLGNAFNDSMEYISTKLNLYELVDLTYYFKLQGLISEIEYKIDSTLIQSNDGFITLSLNSQNRYTLSIGDFDLMTMMYDSMMITKDLRFKPNNNIIPKIVNYLKFKIINNKFYYQLGELEILVDDIKEYTPQCIYCHHPISNFYYTEYANDYKDFGHVKNKELFCACMDKIHNNNYICKKYWSKFTNKNYKTLTRYSDCIKIYMHNKSLININYKKLSQIRKKSDTFIAPISAKLKNLEIKSLKREFNENKNLMQSKNITEKTLVTVARDDIWEGLFEEVDEMFPPIEDPETILKEVLPIISLDFAANTNESIATNKLVKGYFKDLDDDKIYNAYLFWTSRRRSKHKRIPFKKDLFFSFFYGQNTPPLKIKYLINFFKYMKSNSNNLKYVPLFKKYYRFFKINVASNNLSRRMTNKKQSINSGHDIKVIHEYSEDVKEKAQIISEKYKQLREKLDRKMALNKKNKELCELYSFTSFNIFDYKALGSFLTCLHSEKNYDHPCLRNIVNKDYFFRGLHRLKKPLGEMIKECHISYQ